ncbi:hypothetical protein O181_111641 [Austropuccinia psidii MF-1]|uniref:Uncharacterized protein n=1 Tax=Austropuccinia psidii MF-1 TaxID=1389203 RepID=A0A9Q3PSV0_9BASI|nr:hypothetical protein [Austropuccinia psidii MF-1]
MKELTFEPYSDSLRVLDPDTGRVIITHNYAQLRSKTTIVLRKDHSSLPSSIPRNTSPQVVVSLPTLEKRTPSNCSTDLNPVSEHKIPGQDNRLSSLNTPCTIRQSLRYAYLTFYNTAPKDILR